MRYGMTVGDGAILTGSRDEVRSAYVGVLMSCTWEEDILDLQGMAEVAMKRADQQPTEVVTKKVNFGDMNYKDITVWRERGADVPGRFYLVRVGKDVSFRTDSTDTLVTYIAALMVADGLGLERSTALGEKVAFSLSEGGGYPDRVVTELGDRREVRAWFEDGTAGVL